MAYSVVAEEDVLNHLSNISRSNSKALSIGLVIGQINVSKKKVYVIHFAPTPDQSSNPDLQSIEDVDEIIISDHARFITRMLVGGLSCIGFFVVSTGEVFTAASIPCLRKILGQITKTLSDGFPLDGRCLCTERFIFHFNPETQRYSCKNISESLTGTLANTNWKFQNFSSNWIEVDSKIYFDEKEFNVSLSMPVKDQLLELLSQLTKKITDSVITINETESAEDISIEIVYKKCKNTNTERVIFASIYDSYPKDYSNRDVKFFTSEMQRLTVGTVPSCVFLDPSTSVADAILAVKQDLIRTLGARLELHWDSLVDEEGGSPEEKERVHEPPRRVLIRPEGWKICFVDYLFPGEGVSAAVKSCQDLLDIEINEDCVDAQFEGLADASKFINSSIDETAFQNKSSPDASSKTTIQIFLLCLFIVLAVLLNYLVR